MIKKTVTYTDYNGVERTEDLYFNFNKAEILDMQVSTEGGFAQHIFNIIESKDNASIIKTFKDLVLKSYGTKSSDGKRFIKSDELREEFSQTEAYPTIFFELASNAESAVAFIKGIIPADLETIAKETKQNSLSAL